MAQPPAHPILAAEEVRTIPHYAQKVFVCDGSGNPGTQALLANGATLTVAFDIGLKTTDPNQFLGGVVGGTLPWVDPTPFAIGPWLDAMWTSSQVGNVNVDIAVDYYSQPRNIYTIGIVPGVTDDIVSFRIPARFVRVTLTNTSGGTSNVDFGVYVRSN